MSNATVLVLAILVQPSLYAAWTAPAAAVYQMDQTPVTGTNAIMDATGNTQGTLVNTTHLPALSAGAASDTGSSWNFDGGTTYLSVGDPNAVLQKLGNVSTTTGLTIAFWSNYLFGTSSDDYTYMLNYGGTFSVSQSRSAPVENGFLQFTLGNNSNIAQFVIDTAGGLQNGTWHHYVMTVDFTQLKSNVKLYVDGALVSTISNPLQASFTSPSGTTLNIGADGSGKNPFQGSLDQVAIYDFPLQASDVTELYSTGSIATYAPFVSATSTASQVVLPTNSVTVDGTVTDAGQSQTVTTTWSKFSGPSGGTVTFGNAAAISTSATFNIAGTYVLELTANNGTYSTTSNMTVNVLAAAAPTPYASIGGSPIATAKTGASVPLSGSSIQYGTPNSAGTTYLWTSSGPGTATFGSSTSANTTVTFSAAGTYTLTLAATNGGLTSTATLTVTVDTVLPPVVTAAASTPMTLWPTKSTSLTGSATVASGTLSYAWSQLTGPTGSTATFANGSAANTTATFPTPGVYELQLTATANAESTTAPVWVNVWNNDPDPLSTPPVPHPFAAPVAPYVHPRLFFTATDLPDLQNRATNDSVASAAFTTLTNNVNSILYTSTTPYGTAYTQMLAGNVGYSIESVVNQGNDTITGTAGSGFYNVVAAAAYVAWINNNTTQLTNLATVVANSARNESVWYSSGGYTMGAYGLCYDLTFNYMSEDQRAVSRSLLATMTKGVITRDAGNNDWHTSANGDTNQDDFLFASLAIYGETGFDATSDALNYKSMKMFTEEWGVSERGFGRDDVGYYTLGMEQGVLALLAYVHSEPENFVVTSRLYNSALQMFYQMAPSSAANGKNTPMYSHDDGNSWANGAGFSSYYPVMKYLYPNDPLVDWVTRNAIPSTNNGNQPFVNAIFGMAPASGSPTFASVAAAKGQALDIFDPQRGLGISRSDWTTNAARLDFDCRFDVFLNLAHLHSDRNNFNFFALGRVWVGDPGYHEVLNDAHATILIDGLGAAGCTGQTGGTTWPSMPGHFIDKLDNSLYTLYVGDAAPAYNFEVSSFTDPDTGTGGGWGPTPYTWAGLMFSGGSDGMEPAFVPPPTIVLPDNSWINNTIQAAASSGVAISVNPVQRAFRTALFVKGTTPYAVIVDDYQKDNSPHTYKWSSNTIQAGGGEDMVFESGVTATSAVMYHSSDGTAAGVPECLVQALQADGTAVPMYFSTTPDNDGNSANRLVIERDNVVAPNFKTLLFPFTRGSALPTFSWNSSNTVLTILLPNGGPADQFTFTPNVDGRTRVSLLRYTIPLAPAGLVAAAWDGSVDLHWLPPAGVTSYTVLRSMTSGGSYTTLASNVTSTSYTDTGLTDGTTYYYVVQANNPDGSSGNSLQVSAKPLTNGGFDAWTHQDIGNVSQAGGTTYSDGTYTVSGSGADIWGGSDAFQYAYQTLTGDGCIIARVPTEQNTSAYAKVGVMIRNTLDSNSAEAMMSDNISQCAFQYRLSAGASTAQTTLGNTNKWVKLARVGSSFTGYTSADGVTWTQVGTTQTISMNSMIYIGMAVCAHNNTVLNTSTFDSVAIVPTTAWFSQDIGAPQLPGFTTYTGSASDILTMNASGADIWGTSDQFRYAYQSLAGDGSMTVHVDGVQNINQWSKAGVMIRESMATNASYAAIYVTPGQGISFQWRNGTGASANYTDTSGLYAPYWLRLTRSGNLFSSYTSIDGVNWVPNSTVSIPMATNVHIGLALTSHDGTTLGTATFDTITMP